MKITIKYILCYGNEFFYQKKEKGNSNYFMGFQKNIFSNKYERIAKVQLLYKCDVFVKKRKE